MRAGPPDDHRAGHEQQADFLPIIPFPALAAAWLLPRLWVRVARRLPLLATRSASAVAAGVLALLLVPPGHDWVYDSLAPSTEDYVRRLSAVRHGGRRAHLAPVTAAHAEGAGAAIAW